MTIFNVAHTSLCVNDPLPDGFIVVKRPDETPYQRVLRFLRERFPGESYLVETEGEYDPIEDGLKFEVWGLVPITVLLKPIEAEVAGWTST